MPLIGWRRVGALSALAATAVGSVGAHRHEWDAQRKQSFLFAQLYHFAAALAMMSLGGQATAAGSLLLAGTALFSGTVYHRCFTKERHVAHRLAPVGGGCLMAAFLLMALG